MYNFIINLINTTKSRDFKNIYQSNELRNSKGEPRPYPKHLAERLWMFKPQFISYLSYC